MGKNLPPAPGGQSAEVAGYDDPVEAEVDEGDEVAGQLGEQVHGKLRQTRPSRVDDQTWRTGRQWVEGASSGWPTRSGTSSAGRPIMTAVFLLEGASEV